MRSSQNNHPRHLEFPNNPKKRAQAVRLWLRNVFTLQHLSYSEFLSIQKKHDLKFDPNTLNVYKCISFVQVKYDMYKLEQLQETKLKDNDIQSSSKPTSGNLPPTSSTHNRTSPTQKGQSLPDLSSERQKSRSKPPLRSNPQTEFTSVSNVVVKQEQPTQNQNQHKLHYNLNNNQTLVHKQAFNQKDAQGNQINNNHTNYPKTSTIIKI